MTLRLYLVRHGQTDGNAEGRSQGRRDVPLNDRGRRQAAALAERLRERPLVAVYASPLLRSLATAQMIAAPHRLDVQTDARLAELDQGLLDGLTGEEMRRDYADFLSQWRDGDPADLVMPGGESMRDAQARMVAATEAIAAQWPGGEVVAVGHNLATRAFLCHALGVPITTFRRFRHDVASYAELERLPAGGWLVLRLNERCHLPGD
ncbi:MAG: histidine phosphatase family protein [Dehalococcoidia bacterium]